MLDKVTAFLEPLQTRLLPYSAILFVIAAVLVVALAILSVYFLTKLKSARAIISELGKRLGYDPPYGDGAEVFDQEYRKEIIERGREKKVEQLEERIVELEGEMVNKEAELASHQQRWKELEGQLAEAQVEIEKAAARSSDLSQAHQNAIGQLEEHMREKEAEGQASLAAVQERSKELEEQLQQASLWGNKVTTMANDQAQAHRTLVEQMEQRMHEIEAQNIADLTAYQRRTKELEDRLQLASFQHEQLATQASEQVQTHQVAVVQLEQRIRQMEIEGQAYLSALERHARELEEQLQRAMVHNEQLSGQASAKEQVQRTVVDQLEERIRQLEAGGASVEALEQRAKELEEQLQQALQHKEQLAAQASEQEQAHRGTIEQLEERMRQMEAEGAAGLAALQQRASELEEELRRASIRENGITAQANERTQAYRTTIENLEQRIRDMEAEGIASSSAILQRSQELEEHLRQAHLDKDAATAQVGELTQAHQSAIEQLEQRIRQMEADGVTAMGGLEQRAKDLEEKLWQAHLDKDAAAAQAGEQIQAHQNSIGQLEERIRQLESEGTSGLAELHQRSRELEEQLQQVHQEKDAAAAQAGEQIQAHQNSIGQLEERIRQMESEGTSGLAELHQRSRELEEQVQQAHLDKDAVAAQAGEQVQAHRDTIEQLEQRLREMEAEGATGLEALHQRSKELEEQLEQAHLHHESEKTTAQQEALERSADKERLEQRIRDLEAEKEGGASRLQGLEAQVRTLEEQLQTAPNLASAAAPVENATKVTAADLLHRAEWITGRAVGVILPHGLVAAEAYAAAALAEDPLNGSAARLAAELARIHRAFREGLPPVAEAIATFEQKAAEFFAGDTTQAAEIAEDEAKRRTRAGLNRSALLVTNVAIELRQKTDLADSQAMLALKELKATLVERLGVDA